jgi:hypothetical protein
VAGGVRIFGSWFAKAAVHTDGANGFLMGAGGRALLLAPAATAATPALAPGTSGSLPSGGASSGAAFLDVDGLGGLGAHALGVGLHDRVGCRLVRGLGRLLSGRDGLGGQDDLGDGVGLVEGLGSRLHREWLDAAWGGAGEFQGCKLKTSPSPEEQKMWCSQRKRTWRKSEESHQELRGTAALDASDRLVASALAAICA